MGKQRGCFPAGCFPANTKKAQTGKRLQNESICWEHPLPDPENSPCHDHLSHKSAVTQHPGCHLPGPAAGRGHVEQKSPWPWCRRLRVSPTGWELQLKHLPSSRPQPPTGTTILAPAQRHQPCSLQGEQLSSPCPAPSRAITTWHSSPLLQHPSPLLVFHCSFFQAFCSAPCWSRLSTRCLAGVPCFLQHQGTGVGHTACAHSP